MEHPPHHENRQTPGALGLGQAMATRIYCAFYLFYYTTPIMFAIIADSYLGRYTTLVASVVLYCLGCVVLTVSSIASNLEKGWGVPGLAAAMFLIGLGGGGFRAIFVPFIADQQVWTKPRFVTLRTGEQVITDYQITLQYIYNLYYWLVRPRFRCDGGIAYVGLGLAISARCPGSRRSISSCTLALRLRMGFLWASCPSRSSCLLWASGIMVQLSCRLLLLFSLLNFCSQSSS
jgi:dipeptide/tripeptide permease